MASSYKKRIIDYCSNHGVFVPDGFGRNSPSRYAIIRTHLNPAKLVAKTWFEVADVVNFIETQLIPELGDNLSTSIRILDFKDDEILSYNGTSRLSKVGTFSGDAPNTETKSASRSEVETDEVKSA